jgi:DNA polymerase III epsilon subunit-like protein
MPNYTIVFDTETTGLPLPSVVPLDKQPQIIEFCAIKLDDKLQEVGHLDFMLNPMFKPGVTLPPKITEITGIKHEDLLNKNPFSSHYEEICDFFLGTRTLVAHNLGFDKNLLSFELRRIASEFSFPWPPRGLCTVEASFCLKNHRMKLLDLYALATNGGALQGAHRAINDVRATATCLRWLISKGHAKL